MAGEETRRFRVLARDVRAWMVAIGMSILTGGAVWGYGRDDEPVNKELIEFRIGKLEEAVNTLAGEVRAIGKRLP